MYTIDVLPRIIVGAEKYVLDNERMMFRPFFEVVEKFCAETGGIFGGRIGVDLITSTPLSTDSFFWEIYIDNTYENAKELTRRIAAAKSHIIPAKTAEMRTVLKHREFIISVNARAIIAVFSIGSHRSIKLADVIGAQVVPAAFTGVGVKCMPEYIQLSEIYHTLYSPSRARMWSTAAIMEAGLAGGAVSGGGRGSGGARDANGKSASAGVRGVVPKMLEKYFKGGDAIVVGDPHGRMQLLSAEDVNSIAAKLGKILGSPVVARQHDINTPVDFQLTKHTLYVGGNSICDVFNSPAYELVPCTRTGGILYAHPYVTMRFLYIDIWLMRVLAKLRPDLADFAAEKIKKYAESAAELRRDVPKITKDTLFIGIHSDERVAKKKLVKDAGMFFSSFYPIKEQMKADAESDSDDDVVDAIGDAGVGAEITGGGSDGATNAIIDWKQRMLHELVGVKIADIDTMLAEYKSDRVARTIWGEYLAPPSLSRNLVQTSVFLPFIPSGARRQLHIGLPASADLYSRAEYFDEVQTAAEAGGKYDLVTAVHADVDTMELVPLLAPGAIVLVLDYNFESPRRYMIGFELELRGVSRSKWIKMRNPVWYREDGFYPVYWAAYRQK